MASPTEQLPTSNGVEASYARPRRMFILCFDGTGNKFQGTGGDSNILKIYSMLDRTDKTQFHYYQPGIGTYTNAKSLSTSGLVSRISSWYSKAKDSAIGTTLDEHVMAGYRFLMRYYQDGDDICLFGFSRGAYIARLLAEMLDHVGLLSAGNEELVRFVWKTFARWQQRNGSGGADEATRELFRFMKAFRETFSRPVRRIRFLGLFDTVNSVSKFETAWMSRSHRFPYTARSSAKRICHAVSIDERRAKFRQDLISQKKEPRTGDHDHPHLDYFRHHPNHRGRSKGNKSGGDGKLKAPANDRFRSNSRGRSRSQQARQGSISRCSTNSAITSASVDSEDEDENAPQTVTELWFPGCHADIGGGWLPDPPENLSLSHGPLVWMVREAQKAGLVFNPDKLRELGCYHDDLDNNVPQVSKSQDKPPVPIIELNDDAIPTIPSSPRTEDNFEKAMDEDSAVKAGEREAENKKFHSFLHSSCTKGKIHDPLQRNQGSPTMTVLTWNIMEFLPFRRMDLRPDGSWKAIRWPLPMGEVRDVPYDVKIHNSVIRRMKADENYRPGNLILGGGGRGMRKAPEEAGMGDWVVLEDGKGHPIDEVWGRAKKTETVEKNDKF